MSKPFAAAILVATLSACVPNGNPQSPGDAPVADAYFALGTEPGWALEITRDRINYTGDYGATKIMIANPGARPGFNGERYVTDRLVIDVTHGLCSDGMSDRRYADAVTVTADGKTVKGCGGAILPPADLAGTSWTILSIGGKNVASEFPTALAFDGKRLSGSAGCNRIAGDYTSDGKRMTVGPLMMTRMACPAPAMEQEQAFASLLSGTVSLRFTPEGQMVLMGAGGVSAVLARVI